MWTLVVCSGCATSLRVTAAPTVDTLGRWGGLVSVGVGLGEGYRHGRAAVLATADLTGAAGARPDLPGRAGGHVGLGVGVDALGESPRFGFRVGAFVAGRLPLPTDGRVGGAAGGRVALLPVVRYRHAGRPPERCGESESWTYWHVGAELGGAYLFGPDARGLFWGGPTVELDALADRVCD